MYMVIFHNYKINVESKFFTLAYEGIGAGMESHDIITNKNTSNPHPSPCTIEGQVSFYWFMCTHKYYLGIMLNVSGLNSFNNLSD